MVKYREILRLTYLGISQENIAFSCGCARSTVQLIQKLAKSKGLEWPLPGEMDDAAIRAVLYPPKETRDDGKFAIDHEWIEREMGKPRGHDDASLERILREGHRSRRRSLHVLGFLPAPSQMGAAEPASPCISTVARPRRCRSIGLASARRIATRTPARFARPTCSWPACRTPR